MEHVARTLRIIVDDNTTKNPVPEKAKIWVRGNGDWWSNNFKRGLEVTAKIGTREHDFHIYPGCENSNHPGHPIALNIQPVAEKHGSAAYMAMGTVYVEFFDDRICVHGVPVCDELTFRRSFTCQETQIDIVELEKRVAALEAEVSYQGGECGMSNPEDV